jgi:hypothetical protein
MLKARLFVTTYEPGAEFNPLRGSLPADHLSASAVSAATELQRSFLSGEAGPPRVSRNRDPRSCWVSPARRICRGARVSQLADDRDVDRLRFVARAPAATRRRRARHRMAEVVATRSTEVQQRIADLIALAGQLQYVAAWLQGTPAAGPCGDDCPCVSKSPVDTQTPVPLGRAMPFDEGRRDDSDRRPPPRHGRGHHRVAVAVAAVS